MKVKRVVKEHVYISMDMDNGMGFTVGMGGGLGGREIRGENGTTLIE